MIELNVKKELTNIDLDVSLHIKEGEFLAICGKSGSGKTTFLRVLAGLENSNSTIKVSNEIWQDKQTKLPPQKREIGFVFQSYALFENMSVEQNLLFVKKDKELCQYLLKTTELYELRKHYPKTLSGGQKQRVALCRALMNKPKILLLDEPLSALDIEMRKKLQDEIKFLHKKFNITTILVSHDYSEIYKMATRIVEFRDGKVIKDTKLENELSDVKTVLHVDVEVVQVKKGSVVVSFFEQIFEVQTDKNLEVGDGLKISFKDGKIV